MASVNSQLTLTDVLLCVANDIFTEMSPHVLMQLSFDVALVDISF